MTAPMMPDDRLHPQRVRAVRANVSKLRKAGAPPEVIAEYLADEGMDEQEIHADRYGALDAVASGATFGLWDEAKGAAMGALSPDMTMGEGIDAIRVAQGKFREDHPFISMGSEIAGGLATGGLGAMKAAPSLVRAGARALAGGKTLGAAAKAGALGGALYGAGESEGGLSERAAGALKGAGIGAVAGPGVALAGRGVAATGRALGGTQAARRALAGALPEESGARALLESNNADAARRKAAELMARAVERDGTDLARVTPKRPSPNTPVALADLGGESVRGMVRAAQAIPSEAKQEVAEFFERRAEGTGSRVARAAKEAFGRSGRKDVPLLADNLVEQRSEAAGELFGEAFKTRPVVDDKEVAALIKKNPIIARAYGMARKMLADEQEALPKVARKVKGKDGKVRTKQVEAPSLKALHYTKIAIDRLVEGGLKDPLDPNAVAKTQGKIAQQAKDKLLAAMNRISPEYEMAAKQFAGDSESMRALEAGRKVWSNAVDARQLKRELAAMPDADRELVREGALDALLTEYVDRGTRDPVNTLMKNEEMQRKLRVLLPDRTAYAKFRARMVRETRMRETGRKVIGNSVTARAQQEIGEVTGEASDALPMAFAALRRDLPALVMRGAQVVGARAKGVNSSEIARELGRMGIARPGTKQYDEVIELITAAAAREGKKAVGRSRVRGAVVGTGSGRLAGLLGGRQGGEEY